MPRPISWLNRLHEIRRSVEQSSRSHYDRGDLERVFRLSPRSAQVLLQRLPSTALGTSRLVDRSVLIDFLEQVRLSDNPNEVVLRPPVAAAAKKKAARKPRHLVRTDRPPASLAALPENLTIERGRVEVRFASLEELAETMYGLAQILEHEGDELARVAEPLNETGIAPEVQEMRAMFSRLQRLESERRAHRPTAAAESTAAEQD